MHTGDLIREAREARGFSQAKLAALIDVAPSTVYRWETGGSEPPFSTAGRLARALDVPLDALLVHVPEADTPPNGGGQVAEVA